jgi:hypothetical protein
MVRICWGHLVTHTDCSRWTFSTQFLPDPGKTSAARLHWIRPLDPATQFAPAGHRFQLIALAVASAWAVCISVYVRLVPLNYIDFEYIRDQRQYFLYAAFFLLPIYFAYVSSQLIRGRQGDYPVKLVISAAAFTIMYIHAMSGVISDHAMLLAGSLLIGTVLSTAVAWSIVRDGAVYFACAVMVFAIVVQRNALPYYWWGVKSLPPTWGQRRRSTIHTWLGSTPTRPIRTR